MYDYIKVCKQCNEVIMSIDNYEQLLNWLSPRLYFMTGTEMLALNDFIQVKNEVWDEGQLKNGQLLPWLDDRVKQYEQHIMHDCIV